MGDFIVAFKTIFPLFLIIFIGFLFSKMKLASDKWVDVLNEYAFKVGFPALMIGALMNLDVALGNYMPLIEVNSVFIIVCMFSAYPLSKLFRYSNKKKRTLFIVLSFGNVAYLGMPVLQNAFGNEILPIAALIASVYAFWLLTLGLFLVEVHGAGKLDLKNIILSLIKNPLLLSVIIGIIIMAFHVNIPKEIEKTIHLFGDSVTAIVLFSLGIFLGNREIGRLKDWIEIFGFVVLVMLVLPAIFYYIINFTGLKGFHIPATIIDAAMPVGLTPYVLAVQYKLESDFTARLVVLATTLSLIIIPMWMVIV